MLEDIKTALEDGQATDFICLPTEKQSGGLFSQMVVVTAGSARHAAALTDRTRRAVKSAGGGSVQVEASAGREWVLIDCGDILVHIFLQEAREWYRLEELWGFEEQLEN